MAQNEQSFADLRVHSHYSYRDGVCSVEKLVEKAVALGRTSMALTDHCHAAGFVQLQEAADKYGLANPIFGVDAAMVWEGKEQYKLPLLAQNEAGLKNLFKVLTWAGTTGYDLSGADCQLLTEEYLLENTEGLVVLSGGPQGKLSQLLAAGDEAGAVAYASRLREAFGENFYVELVSHQSAAEDRARLIAFARQHSLQLLATSDVHYISPEQAVTRDFLWAINDNVRLNDPKRRRPTGNDAHPLTLEELQTIFADVPEALQNTAKVAESCRVRLPKATLIIPNFSIPASFENVEDGKTSAAGRYLEHLARQGLQDRLGEITEAVETRLKYELGVMEKAGFSRYILIVADIVRKAQELNILCAPRGSSAGSLVCYAVGIAPLNPMEYNLVFERFLNEARLAPPDIDLDIADEDRPRLLDYTVRKYGVDNVAHIITHNFEGAKSALRDTGKVLGSDPIMVNKLVGLVPIEFQRPFSLTRTLEEVKEVAGLYKRDKGVKELMDYALMIEGTGRNSGTHAAGVVITPRPTWEYVPLTRTEGLAQKQRDQADNPEESSGKYLTPTVMTQWDMEGVEKRGLLKIDLLGLTAWSTVANALAYIEQERGEKLDVWKLPTDNEAAYDVIGQGHTIGIFQLEGYGVTDFSKGMKPRNIADLGFLIAAYRPGPMPFLGKILAVRNGRETLEAPHPALAPLLAESYGAPVYQETMLRIAQEVAGYTLGEADVLRKAIGKKNQAELNAQHAKFVEGAKKRDFKEEEAEAIWQFFPPFAFYGFNQAHALVYGYLTYLTAYLKVNYSVEYLGALLTVAGGDTAAVTKAAQECSRLNVPLLGPDVNRSAPRIIIDTLPDGRKALRMGLAAVKGLGPTGLEAILASRREGGEFTGLGDFVRRVPGRSVNSRALTALARVGALPFGNRAQIEEAITAAQKAAKAKTFSEVMLPDTPEHPLNTLQGYEMELLGFALSVE